LKQNTRRFELKPGPVLLACAAGVQGMQYAQAFALVHGHSLGQFAQAGGWLAGTVVVGAVAFAGTRLPRLKAKSAQKWSTAFFYLLLTISPFILTPVNYYSMDAGLRSAIGWYAWVLAGLVASVPELALALVAFVDRDLLAQPSLSDARAMASETPASLSDAQRPSQRRSAKSATLTSDARRRSAKSATLTSDARRRSAMEPASLYRCECGQTYSDRFQYSGHAGKCAAHQQARSGQLIPVEIPSPKASKQ
jgi:hypothetical protein